MLAYIPLFFYSWSWRRCDAAVCWLLLSDEYIINRIAYYSCDEQTNIDVWCENIPN